MAEKKRVVPVLLLLCSVVVTIFFRVKEAITINQTMGIMGVIFIAVLGIEMIPDLFNDLRKSYKNRKRNKARFRELVIMLMATIVFLVYGVIAITYYFILNVNP